MPTEVRAIACRADGRRFDHREAGPVSCEETLEELQVAPRIERGAGGNEAHLLRTPDQVQTVKEVAQQIGHLGPRGAAIHVKLVDHHGEHVTAVGVKPVAGALEEPRIALTQKHDVQHRVVGDQDVRRMHLHVPPRAHLPTVQQLNEEPLVLGPAAVVVDGSPTACLEVTQIGTQVHGCDVPAKISPGTGVAPVYLPK